MGMFMKCLCILPQEDGTVPPPHMIVVPLASYDKTEKRFEIPGTCSKDKLLPRGHQYCRAEEYHLGETLTISRDSVCHDHRVCYLYN